VSLRLVSIAVAPTIDIRLLPPEAGDDAIVVQQIADLVNLVYADAERGLWRDGAARTTTREVTDQIHAREIAVARLDDRIVGAVRIQQLDATTGEFGMLTAHPAHRGSGIGRELMRFAERTSRATGADSMQLELLVPREWTHPVKEFLAAWYQRAGYRLVRTGTIDEAYPALAPRLATPCDFQIYRKALSAP
jgi:ribosomal protein S18 acetylase RimI-like enzyme